MRFEVLLRLPFPQEVDRAGRVLSVANYWQEYDAPTGTAPNQVPTYTTSMIADGKVAYEYSSTTMSDILIEGSLASKIIGVINEYAGFLMTFMAMEAYLSRFWP